MTFPSPLIGILGGMGPQAGLDLADKLVALTRTACDQDHVPFMLFSIPGSIPDRTDFLLGKEKTNPAFEIADQLGKMSGMGVTTAVMACNTAHAAPIFDRILELLRAKGVELRILHMIRETVAYIRDIQPEIRRIGILGTQGTYRSGVYEEALAESGLDAILPDPNVRRDDIHAAIYAPSFGIKTCPRGISEEAIRRIHSAIRHLRELGAEAVILGCTELPLAIREDQVAGLPILDPAKIVAEKLLKENYPDRLVDSAGS